MRKTSLLLLIVIYLTFIALGLPDALLGSAWNSVRTDLRVSLGYLGVMTFVVYVTTIFATLNAPHFMKWFETKRITFFSVLLTGIALFLMSQVSEFYQLLFFAVPLGLGAGAIDVSLNHYMAMNYKAQHMNYLHSFYGIGVTFGPTVMAYSLDHFSWRTGYLAVGSILLVIAAILFFSFSLWKKETEEERLEQHATITTLETLHTRGVPESILIITFSVNVESLGGAWIASYFFVVKETSFATAALFTTAFYLTYTIGRFLGGVLSHKIHSYTLILWGEGIIVLSGLLLFLEVDTLWPYFIIAGLYGLGSCPIYPNMMYLNALHFDKNKLSKIMSLQMGIGYLGFGVLTPLYGWIFDMTTIRIYPFFVVGLGVLLIGLTQRMGRLLKANEMEEVNEAAQSK